MFVPHQASPAMALDQGMREDLAASLAKIAAMTAGVLPQEAGLEAALGHIRGHRVEPGVFALYYDLVFALQARALTAAGALWSELLGRTGVEPAPRLLRFGPRDLGADSQRLSRLLTIGSARPPDFCDPADDDWGRFVETVPAALALLEQAAPAWVEELRRMVVWTLAAVPGAGPDAALYSGGSSVMAWGALMVNVRGAPGRVRVLDVITHEETHLLLLGAARAEPLVTNPVEERFRTELRPTPRPMNALYHSTYVSGRSLWLCRALQDRCAADLSPAELEQVESSAEVQRGRFEQGLDLIRRDARLTPLGHRLIEEAAEALE